MNIAIFENNDADKTHLKNILNQYFKNKNITCEIYCFHNPKGLLDSLFHVYYSLYILNISANTNTGFTIGKKIRDVSLCPIIFTADEDNFAVPAFELNATHYLLKPIKYDGLFTALSRCKDFLNEGLRSLNVKVGHSNQIIPQSIIRYIEIWNKVATIYTENDIIKTYDTLENLFSKLDHSQFIRPQRSFIVNMNFISSISNNKIVLKNALDITLSRMKQNSIKLQIQEFFFEQK